MLSRKDEEVPWASLTNKRQRLGDLSKFHFDACWALRVGVPLIYIALRMPAVRKFGLLEIDGCSEGLTSTAVNPWSCPDAVRWSFCTTRAGYGKASREDSLQGTRQR